MTNKNDALPVVAWDRTDPTFVVEYLRHNTSFDADLVGQMLEFATTKATRDAELAEFKRITNEQEGIIAQLRYDYESAFNSGEIARQSCDQLQADLSAVRETLGETINARNCYQWECERLQAELAALRERVTKYEAELIKISDGVQFWNDGAPPSPYSHEWFIAELKDGSKVVLSRLPEEFSYDYKTADGSYFTADWVVRWAQFPDSDYLLYAAPLVSDKAGANLILPEYDVPAFHSEGSPNWHTANGWNAALAEVERLNPNTEALNPLAADVAQGEGEKP